MDRRSVAHKRAISPIIATLLLILIAIAAGVVVYTYVLGFVGNTTGNPGGTPNTLSIDQMVLSSNASVIPATVFVRNLGPATESFNNGFYVKSSSVNSQLGVAVAITDTKADTINSVMLSSVSGNLTVTLTQQTCAGGTIKVSSMGITSTTQACAAGAMTFSLPRVKGFTFTNDADSPTHDLWNLTLTSGNTFSPSGGVFVVAKGLDNRASMSLGVNAVGQLTLAPLTSTSPSTNPLTAGLTYTVQVTGADGATVSQGAKSF